MDDKPRFPILEIGPPTSIKIKRGKKKTTFVEQPKDVPAGHTAATTALQKLYDREAPELEHVVVRCNRATGKWHLYKNNEPYKEMTSLIIINVKFSNEWDKKGIDGCTGLADGAYMGFAAGNVLPVATPMTVPTDGVCRIMFDAARGEFYDRSTGSTLKGAGYLILKEGCSAEYVNASAIGAV